MAQFRGESRTVLPKHAGTVKFSKLLFLRMQNGWLSGISEGSTYIVLRKTYLYLYLGDWLLFSDY